MPPACTPYGKLSDGRSVERWTLTGTSGLQLEFLTYGGIVTRLLVPDAANGPVDVVLGLPDLPAYEASGAYFGAIVGRIAGRVRGARFPLDGKEIVLEANEAPNHLHGGSCGFNKRIWTAEPIERPDGAPSVRLYYRSPDGEEGYPGTLDVFVTYTLTEDNAFLIETEARSDRPTPLNLTHHSYFQLSGEGWGDILDHRLRISSNEFAGRDDAMALDGTVREVGPENDFRKFRTLREAVPQIFASHGDLYRLQGDNPAAVIEDPRSGRTMEVETNCPWLQFYSGKAFDGSIRGKSGRPYEAFAGFCLEAEGFPDALNFPETGDILVHPETPQKFRTAYRFAQ